MPDYLLFDGDRKGFDDGEGNMVSLGKHLDYLASYGGTPDMMDSLEDMSYQQMKMEVMKRNENIFVVDESELRVVYKATKRELDYGMGM